MEKIEKEIAEKVDDQIIELTEEEEMIYKIKLSALEKEIELVRLKVHKLSNQDSKNIF